MARRFRLVALALMSSVLCGAGAGPASAAPRNDDFADALPIRLGETLEGTTVGATMQAGERARPVDHGRSVWYRFRATRTVSVRLDTTCPATDDAGDSLSVGMSVYTGRSLRSAALVDLNAGGCSEGGARVSFTALPKRTYRIAILAENYPSESPGVPFRLQARKIDAPANDDFARATRLVSGSAVVATTRNATLELGEPMYAARTVWFKLRLAQRRNVSLKLSWPGSSCLDDLPGLDVFTGGTVSRLIEIRYTEYDNTSRSDTFTFRFTARPNLTYRIQVSESRAGGRFRLATRVR
jgi:hypothetical protein